MKNEYIGHKNDKKITFISTCLKSYGLCRLLCQQPWLAESEWIRELDEASTVFKTWKKNYPQEAELNWWFYSGRMGIRPRVTKHLWENRHNNQMNRIPYDQDKRIMEAQTAKIKDQQPVIKMVTPVEQATEMVKSEIKRECEMAKNKTFLSPGRRQNVNRSMKKDNF